MPLHDGEARFGRFIKKDDPLLKTIAVSEFALEEISTTYMLMADNLDGNIYHMQAHEPVAHELGVKDASRVMIDLMSPEMQRPILRPMDFTEEWRKQRSKNSRRHGGDDDEAWDAEMEAHEQEALRKKSQEKEADGPSAADLALMASLQKNEEAAAMATAAANSAEKPTQAFRIQRQTMDEMGDVIAKAGIHAEGNTMPLDKMHGTQAPERQGDFVPLSAARDDAMATEVAQPEEDAMERYRAQLAEKKVLAQEEQRQVEEAKAKGYHDGFKEGEEKAALQLMQNNRQVLEQVGRMVESLENLKKDVLQNAQDNFQVLCQALMESLLRREFSVNPESFQAIIQRAIDETITNDQFKIRVNPGNYHALDQVLEDRLRKRLVVDENVKEGDFRIETNLSVVDGNVTQLVRDLLDQADLELFDNNNSLNKAG